MVLNLKTFPVEKALRSRFEKIIIIPIYEDTSTEVNIFGRANKTKKAFLVTEVLVLGPVSRKSR